MEWNEKSLMTNEVTKKHVAKYNEIGNRGKFLIPLLIYWNTLRHIIKRSSSGRNNNKIPLLINYIITSIKDKIFIYIYWETEAQNYQAISWFWLYSNVLSNYKNMRKRGGGISTFCVVCFIPTRLSWYWVSPLSHAPVEDKMVCALQFNGCLMSIQ